MKVELLANCYRSILAQANYLDGIFDNKVKMKELYEELAVLAFFIMDKDCERIIKEVSQIEATILDFDIELNFDPELKNYEKARFDMLINELKTHLNYLVLVCKTELKRLAL